MNNDFRDLLQSLCDAEVRFLVVGAYALGVHGLPRATGDIDVWVAPSVENAEKVYRALGAFGAPLQAHGVQPSDFASPGIVFQMGVPPRRIDILTAVSGLQEFEAAWARRTSGVFGGVTAPVIGFDDLITNKSAAARDKDLLDVAALERIRRLRGGAA